MAMIYNSVGPVLEESVSAVTATPSRSVGDRVFVDGEEYVYCYNAGGAQISKGLGVKFVTGCSGYSVAATSVTDVMNPCVGVCKHSTMAAADYGWIMVKGFTSLTVVSATTADYLALALGAAGTFVEAEPEVTTAGTGIPVAVALNANTGAGGSVYAYVKAYG